MKIEKSGDWKCCWGKFCWNKNLWFFKLFWSIFNWFSKPNWKYLKSVNLVLKPIKFSMKLVLVSFEQSMEPCLEKILINTYDKYVDILVETSDRPKISMRPHHFELICVYQRYKLREFQKHIRHGQRINETLIESHSLWMRAKLFVNACQC